MNETIATVIPASTPESQVKISDWLKTWISSHEIYDSRGLGEKFKAITGCDPCWPEHSHGDTIAAIRARGLGGQLDDSKRKIMHAYGWEVAESCARTFANWQGTFQQGRGSRFRSAIAALEAAGQ